MVDIFNWFLNLCSASWEDRKIFPFLKKCDKTFRSSYVGHWKISGIEKSPFFKKLYFLSRKLCFLLTKKKNICYRIFKKKREKHGLGNSGFPTHCAAKTIIFIMQASVDSALHHEICASWAKHGKGKYSDYCIEYFPFEIFFRREKLSDLPKAGVSSRKPINTSEQRQNTFDHFSASWTICKNKALI